MNRRKFVHSAAIAAMATGTGSALLGCSNTPSATLQSKEILHTVVFDLKHGKDAPESLQFLADGQRILSAIPVVRNFQVFRQTSQKNDFNYGFSMIFSNPNDYQAYNNHPDHVAFVSQRWNIEVSRFQESDFETL